MKQKALRAGDAHSHEDEECRKRLRSARECAKAHSFFCVYDEPSAGKALPQTIIFTLDKMISFKKEKNYGFN